MRSRPRSSSGKALYAGISSYGPRRTREAAAILRDLKVPLLIHQPSYSLLNRWVEGGLLATLRQEGIGCIAFSPLAQGLLSSKYLHGIPAGSRAAADGSLKQSMLSEQNLARVRALDGIARRRGQRLAQLAIAWVLRNPGVTSALDRREPLGTGRRVPGNAAAGAAVVGGAKGNRPSCRRGRTQYLGDTGQPVNPSRPLP